MDKELRDRDRKLSLFIEVVEAVEISMNSKPHDLIHKSDAHQSWIPEALIVDGFEKIYPDKLTDWQIVQLLKQLKEKYLVSSKIKFIKLVPVKHWKLHYQTIEVWKKMNFDYEINDTKEDVKSKDSVSEYLDLDDVELEYDEEYDESSDESENSYD